MTAVMALVISLTTSAIIAGAYFFNDNDEKVIEEIEDIKQLIHRSKNNYIVAKDEANNITTKICILKNKVEEKNKLYDMVLVLENEWNEIKTNLDDFKRKQLSYGCL